MTPSEEYELQKKIAADEAAAKASNTPPTPAAAQWTLAGAMLSGIQSMGRAVQVSGDVVDRINLETQAALEKRVRSTAAYLVSSCKLTKCLLALIGLYITL